MYTTFNVSENINLFHGSILESFALVFLFTVNHRRHFSQCFYQEFQSKQIMSSKLVIIQYSIKVLMEMMILIKMTGSFSIL